MKINVIIPMFNHGAFVERCLESICRAYSGLIDIIVCDDASGDDSFEIARVKLENIKSISSGRITYSLLRNDVNQGVCFTLNRCVSLLTANYVYLIASDDYLLDKSLDHAMDIIRDKGCDALISDCHVVGMDGELLFDSAFFGFRRAFRLGLESRFIREELVMNWTVPGPALLLKSAVYKSIGTYRPGLKAEDRDFYLRMLAHCKVAFSSAKIACYRIHERNASTTEVYLDGIDEEMASVNLENSPLYSGRARSFLQTYSRDLAVEGGRQGRKRRKKLYRRFRMKLKILDFLGLI